MENSPHFVTLRALAKRLCLPATWLKAETDRGRIPCLRAGRRCLYNVEAVEQCLLNRAVTNGFQALIQDGDKE